MPPAVRGRAKAPWRRKWTAKLGWYIVSDVLGFTAGVLGVLDS